MASITPISHSQPLFKKPQLVLLKKPQAHFLSMPISNFSPNKARMVVVSATTAAEKSKKRYPGEAKGFVEEMRFVAMKLHTKDQAKEGEKEPQGQPVARWEPSVEGYLRFLVDSKLVYDTLERIVEKAAFPEYAEFKNTGLERSENLAKDLEWFKEQGHAIPEPSSPGTNYAQYLEELSEKDPPAFICHFYNTYFAHSAGGRMIGRKVAEKILNGRELEFYKWEGELSQLLQNVRDKLNRVAENWSRDEKDHCLEETEKSFKFSGEILRLLAMASLFNKVMIKPQAVSWSSFSLKRSRVVVVAVSAATGGRDPRKKFADEMRMAAMKLHKPGQAKAGDKDNEKEPAGLAIAKWEPTLQGYLNFLADTQLIYQTLEQIVDKAVHPEYAEFRKTGLERSEGLVKDMEWFEQQGHTIPQPSSLGINYARYLNDLSENNPHAFICHFYMTYFGHTAGGRIIGKKVEESILKGKELEFYKYQGELPQLLQNVRDKLNTLGERWSKEEKDRCLDEIENSFNYGGDILRLVLF